MMSGGIIYEYEDGGSYCGEWEGETSHGFGVCTGPKGQGVFEGQWDHGNQLSGVYRWPNGMRYSGLWQNNMRHGPGAETRLDGTEFSGDFTRGTRGPYGVAKLPNGVYQGHWVNGAQDGEGVETYRDKGCYRGQYKKGFRTGHGTRTSATYEMRGEKVEPSLPKSGSEPAIHSIIKNKNKNISDSRLQFGSLKRSSILSSVLKSTDSTSSLPPKSLSHKTDSDEIAQIYEGEWKNDKRHGHGVLKVTSNYTYYGQWVSNRRTGYGVTVYENGAKEEGEWHNGKLMVALKRNKVLLFKTHQLESKVKEAHTKALQAAETARNKAKLASSRACSALAKSRLAQQTALQASKHSRLAVEKAELHKNAPRVAEGVSSPIIDTNMTFPPSDSPSPYPTHHSRSSSTLSTTSSSDSPKVSRLEVNSSMASSSSFEDIRSIYSDSGHTGSLDRGSESSGSPLNRRKPNQSTESFSSVDENVSLDATDAAERLREKRDRLKRHQYGSSSDHSIEKFSPETRRRLRRVSDTMINPGASKRSRKNNRSLSLSDHEEEDEYNLKGQRSLQRRDERTGTESGESVDHGLEDDYHVRSSEARLRTRPPLVKKNTITLDMLNQMAKWNKMVACVNFALLIFLLVLILTVFLSMYYYQLVSYYKNHPDPEEQSSPRGFLTPLA